ncbi:hypothetical protein V8J36_20580 [Frigidibacter sp. MR17.14]|uniref:hypothetical protein n=1 Tax=Frigidibacter sp. MR17.14 TaxID=3126509 RepID=UPI003012E61F
MTEDGDLAATGVDKRPDAETVLIRQGEARHILDCLATLDPDRARAVRSAYLDGETCEGIAEAI